MLDRRLVPVGVRSVPPSDTSWAFIQLKGAVAKWRRCSSGSVSSPPAARHRSQHQNQTHPRALQTRSSVSCCCVQTPRGTRSQLSAQNTVLLVSTCSHRVSFVDSESGGRKLTWCLFNSAGSRRTSCGVFILRTTSRPPVKERKPRVHTERHKQAV